jgi:polysaccharide export outer membrane protein
LIAFVGPQSARIKLLRKAERTRGKMRKLLSLVAIAVSAGLVTNAGEDQKAPPSELIQYLQQAARAGLSDAEIQKNAVNAGWPAPMVSNALTSMRTVAPAQEVAAAKGSPSVPPDPGSTSAPSAAGEPAPSGNIPPAATIDVRSRPNTRGLLDDYHIGAGDVLQISVWKEPDASVPSAVVRPDGKIAMPLLKDVPVVGLTPTETEKLIAERLAKYIPDANVTVVVSGINSKKIYILGAVKKEGPIAYTYPMTIMQALSEAGGITDYAKRKKIYVLRTENGKQLHLPFDYDAVLRGERMELNVPLLPNDTLVVPH